MENLGVMENRNVTCNGSVAKSRDKTVEEIENPGDDRNVEENENRGDDKTVEEIENPGDDRNVEENENRGDHKNVEEIENPGDDRNVEENENRGDHKNVEEIENPGDDRNVEENENRGDHKNVEEIENPGDDRNVEENEIRGDDNNVKGIEKSSLTLLNQEIEMENLGIMENRNVTCNGSVVKSRDKNVEEIENPGDDRNVEENENRGDDKTVEEIENPGDDRNVEENENRGDDNNVKEIENPEFLADLELYFDDISDRLTISRMVSDSIIKGMISAVEQEAMEKVAEKDLELARLKETMQPFHVGSDENGVVQYSGASLKSKDFSDVLIEQDRVQESMGNLKIAAKEQFKKLKKEIDRIRRKGSGSELVGLSGILEEKMLDNWVDVDKTNAALKTTIDSVYKQVEDMVHSPRISLIEWQQDREFQTEIEGIVIKNCIWGLQKDFEKRWWDQNARTCGNESANQLRKVKEISSVRKELEAITKSLSASESGQLISHGSLEHRKTSANHVSSTASLWDGNGKHDQSIINMPENFDLSTLKHMERDELANYFKNEMTKMKRQHESKVQEMTEEYFSLKRKYLNERGSSVTVKKDEELENLRKKIPEVISKLDSILVETEKFPAFPSNADSIDKLRERLESLQSENHKLSGLLSVKKKELRSLSTQVSDAAEKMSEHSLTEANFLKKNLKLKSALEDAHIEASLSADLYRFLVKELLGQIECSQETHMQQAIAQAIDGISRELARNCDPISKVEIEDSEMETLIMQGIYGDIFKEALKEAEGKLSDVNMQWISENKIRSSLEMEMLEKERELTNCIAEKEQLAQQLLSLTGSVDEKVKLLQEGANALREEKEKFEQASQELESVKVQKNQQQVLLSLRDEELQDVKNNFARAIEKIASQNSEISELRKSLEHTTKSLSEITEQKRELLNVSQERQNALLLFEAREAEYKKQMESMILLLNGLSETLANFECSATANIKALSLRLETLSSEFSWVIQKVNRLKRTGLLYRQRLERKCADLQKAEAEVDLLGDEVDTLLGLLEKIYIALDHYSPVLEHYPGIIEILKLVRRELSGESMKPV